MTLFAIAAVIFLVILLALAARQPDHFRLERVTLIKARPEVVFALINDFHQWDAWSPWARLDPAMRATHSGANDGIGAVYEWQGNNKVGRGRMEIVAATAPSAITIKLDFLKPFEAHNVAEFTLSAPDKETRVSWAMHGPQPSMAKLMAVFVSMDRMVGKDFEAGLAKLKARAEATG